MPKTASKKEKVVETRNVIYPEVEVRVFTGEDAITPAQAKNFLGWEEEPEGVKFGSDYLLTDRHDKKIRCLNNVTNRPLYNSVVETLAQEHLTRKWKFNGEPILIGKTGLILNGQHTLISLVLAEQDRTGPQSAHWEKYWTQEVTMEKLVVQGLEEDDATVNTMDTCKPRSLADVIYRSHFFAKFAPGDRKVVSRITDYSIRFLWHRTGAGLDAFAPRRTHAEALDFIDRHPKLLNAVKHIHEEEAKGSISKPIGLGYAAGILYLMGCSKADGDEYRAGDPPAEKKLDWDMWDKASEFWVLFSSNNHTMKEVRHALNGLHGVDGEDKGSLDERVAIFAKAWKAYAQGYEIHSKDLKLKYHTDEDGSKTLAECPDFGGIDLGNPKEKGITADTEEEEVVDPKEKARKAKAKEIAEELQRRRAAENVPDKNLGQELEEIQAAHKDKVLLFTIPSGYAFYAPNVETVLNLTKGYKAEKYKGMDRVKIPSSAFKAVTDLLKAAGKVPAVVEMEEGKAVVKDIIDPNANGAKPRPKAKAKAK